MFEIWLRPCGDKRYLPYVWCFEPDDANAFAAMLRRRGFNARVIYNPTCAMDGWKPPREMAKYCI